MLGAVVWGVGGVRTASMVLGDTSIMGLPMFQVLIVLAIAMVALAGAISLVRKRRRRRLVEQLRTQQKAMEAASSDLFTSRKASEIREAVPDPGQPTTVVSEGAVAYTEAGERLVFKSTPLETSKDVVASRVVKASATAGGEVATWSPTYVIDRIVAIHMTGVAMFSLDPTGRVKDGRNLEPELLIGLERLLEEARWRGGEMVSMPLGDHTLCLTWGEEMHMGALVDGEPDERLDRELRWAIGDLAEQFSDEIWSWDEIAHQGASDELLERLSKVFKLTADVDLETLAARSSDGSLRATSTLAWRHGLVEYTLGITNSGPGSVHDVELLPSLSKQGVLEVVTVNNVNVDEDGRFMVDEIHQGAKAIASFVFKAKDEMKVRVDCTVVYLRGLAAVQEVSLPGRWIELERVELLPGEPVEPERALELAIQPAAFRDRFALFTTPGISPGDLFNAAIELLKVDFSPVVELEDDDGSQLEAWFHAELFGGGTAVASVTIMPRKRIVDLFVSTTRAVALPWCTTRLRSTLERAALKTLPDVLDPELRTEVPRVGMLLLDSWGIFDE